MLFKLVNHILARQKWRCREVGEVTWWLTEEFETSIIPETAQYDRGEGCVWLFQP